MASVRFLVSLSCTRMNHQKLIIIDRWSAIQTLLERSVSDVMILLDCCAGAASATFPTGKTSITETISASSWDAIAPDPGRYSFTNALIEVLEEWRQRTFSAAMLHAEILARLKHPRPILINGKHFEARTTPVHFMMTSNHRAPSIELCRLVPTKRLPPSPPNELAYWNQPVAYWNKPPGHPRMIEGRNPVEQYPLAPHPPHPDFAIPATSDPNEDEPHVLISLALEDDQRLDLNDWENWLASFPAIAKYVKVQGVFKSHSTLLLLSLPVMVWDFLPDDPACSFVAFIRSNNLLGSQKAAREPEPTEVPVTETVQDSNPVRDDAESCLSGTTYRPNESLDNAQEPVVRPNIQRAHSTSARATQGESHANPSWASHSGASAGSQLARTLTSASLPRDPRLESSLGSLAGSLRNAPSTSSLRTVDQLQHDGHGPRNDLPSSADGITRKMILNRTRTSKKSVFQPDQAVPEGHQLAPHIVGRLEEYFQRDPEPNLAIVEHIASNLGVEPSDIHVCSFPL